jgi:hypothetical protein
VLKRGLVSPPRLSTGAAGRPRRCKSNRSILT